MTDRGKALDSKAQTPVPEWVEPDAELLEPAPENAELKPKSDETVPAESGGPSGPEPTRYGDWERNGRCIDF